MPVQILMKGSKNEEISKILDLMKNVLETSEHKSRGLSPDSTGLPDVKLVDGLPSARHLNILGRADILTSLSFWTVADFRINSH